jgi:hypothetical protein
MDAFNTTPVWQIYNIPPPTDSVRPSIGSSALPTPELKSSSEMRGDFFGGVNKAEQGFDAGQRVATALDAPNTAAMFGKGMGLMNEIGSLGKVGGVAKLLKFL